MKRKLFVANWKMNMPFAAAVYFVQQYCAELSTLASDQKQIVLCPSFPALHPIHEQIDSMDYIALGAQNCSEHERGPFTGEVSALSLAQVGCRFCIVGHSEQRRNFHEKNEIVAKKVLRLLEQSIEPIICIGEQKEDYERNATLERLTEQLNPIVTALKQSYYTPSSFTDSWFGNGAPSQFCIAYEPVWSIGTGMVADASYIDRVASWIIEYVKDHLDFEYNLRVLYGGSVDPHHSKILGKLDSIDGFLIGGASLDFQKLKNIVSLE